MIIRKQAYPRAGLIGNPSDGYFGKTISVTFGNFYAQVVLYETPELKILPHTRDRSDFSDIASLVEDVRLYGYYGGLRLLKATIKRFWEYCQERGVTIEDRKFTIRYYSNIPHLVGLAGSSAIITACLRGLMEFYGVQIPKPLQANLILSVEKNELGISAGLQDRVTQVYQGLVYMDFSKGMMERQGYGRYEELDSDLLPPLYLAYRAELSEGSEVFHNDIRSRFERGDKDVVDAMKYWADLTDQFKAALLARDVNSMATLMNANFDKRTQIYKISAGNLRMVEAARSTGASAKFTGSGGAIVGIFRDEEMYTQLRAKLEPMGVRVARPEIVPASGEKAQ